MSDMHSAIDRLADELVTPMVPGEVAEWLANVYKAAELASALLWRQLESVHNAEYARIVEVDPELFRRVEQMKAKDRDCVEELAKLLDRIKQLQEEAQVDEPDEAAMKESLDAVIEQGLGFVNHARMQGKARETWLAEAYYRDRGVGD
ncbi:MAG: hypothetical protein FJ271_26970 [Planctomycetes bacterium]|nr:hypothetical protein [Planctomycetota bacterium]